MPIEGAGCATEFLILWHPFSSFLSETLSLVSGPDRLVISTPCQWRERFDSDIFVEDR